MDRQGQINHAGLVLLRRAWTVAVPVSGRWQCLQHRHAVAFGVEEGDVGADARDVHGFTEYAAACADHFGDGGLQVIDRDDDRWLLRRAVRCFLEKAAVDGAWLRGSSIGGFAGVGNDVIAHRRAERLCLPAKDGAVKFRHAGRVLIWHFKVDDWIHLSLLRSKGICDCDVFIAAHLA